MIHVGQQVLQNGSLEQRVAIDEHERTVHFVTRHPAGSHVVRKTEKRVVQCANLDAFESVYQFFDELMAKPGNDDHFIDSRYGELRDLPFKYGNTARLQA